MASLEKVLNSLKIASGNKIAVESDWSSKNPQNIPSCFFWKRTDAFSEKNLQLFEISKGSKFAVEWDWNSQFCQNVRKLVTSGFFWKNEFFEKR